MNRLDCRSCEELRTKKLLFLGTGESGKSTVLKQLRCLYGTGISQEEIEAFIPVIHYNIFYNCRSLMRLY